MSAQTTLGSFTFNDAQFGNSLVEGDSGAFASFNYMTTVPSSNPGNPRYLTGADFETGIANVGGALYTIGYNTPIVNLDGTDLTVVVARRDPLDGSDFSISASTNGTIFGDTRFYGRSEGVNTGIDRTFYVQGENPQPYRLYAHSIDLSALGINPGQSAVSVRITGLAGLELLRVAGTNPVPEPATLLALGTGAIALIRRKRAH